MGHKSPIRLPALSAWAPPGPPSVEDARRALGGRVTSDGREGAGVTIDDPRRGRSEGVVICAGRGELDVWIGEGLIARVKDDAALVEPAARLGAVAEDARRFWRLREGDRVVVDGAPGILREQCRYGALVERDATPGKVVAVGFRRLAPA